MMIKKCILFPLTTLIKYSLTKGAVKVSKGTTWEEKNRFRKLVGLHELKIVKYQYKRRNRLEYVYYDEKTEEQYKYCPRCGYFNPLSFFHFRKDVGYQKYCKLHQKLYNSFTNAKYRVSKINTGELFYSKQKLPFEIDLDFVEWLYDQQDGRCFYTNLPFHLDGGDFAVSLDRINNDERGYTLSNTVLCSLWFNKFKSDSDSKLLYEMIRKEMKKWDRKRKESDNIKYIGFMHAKEVVVPRLMAGNHMNFENLYLAECSLN